MDGRSLAAHAHATCVGTSDRHRHAPLHRRRGICATRGALPFWRLRTDRTWAPSRSGGRRRTSSSCRNGSAMTRHSCCGRFGLARRVRDDRREVVDDLHAGRLLAIDLSLLAEVDAANQRSSSVASSDRVESPVPAGYALAGSASIGSIHATALTGEPLKPGTRSGRAAKFTRRPLIRSRFVNPSTM